MINQVRKRDGRIVSFNKKKIIKAIMEAMKESNHVNKETANRIANYISQLSYNIIDIEEIQDIVEEKLMASSFKDVAKAYILYREKRNLMRGNTTDKEVFELLGGESDYWNDENSNKNSHIVTTQRDYLAGILSTDITRRLLLPKDIVEAHDEGIIHFHDADYFGQNALHNCELINLNDMLQNGTVINGVMIEKPHKFLTACTIATQIILGVSSSSYGGATISLSHLAPFVRDSYNKYLEEAKKELDSIDYYSICDTEENFNDKAAAIAKQRLQKEIEAGVQTFNYQVNSMTNTNGQAPFLSVAMYLGETEEYKKELAMIIEEFLKQRILGFKNEKGVHITPAFPKLLYVLEPDNLEDGKYYYLTKLAAQCTAKRMVPDYISEKIMKENKINQWGNGDAYPCMGCRSFLTPWRVPGNISKALDYEEGKGKYYGRFNQGVVTINLPDIAFSSEGNFNKFWKIFDKRLELCHKALQCRYKRLKGTLSNAAPILWQYGALARLDKGETIDKLLIDGYSTISLGYAGLYECVKYMTGKSHTIKGEPMNFGLKIMQHLNDACSQWKNEENIDYSVYGTPIESTTYKFASNLKRRFGEDIFIKLDGKDRNYITNSYHVPVFEVINPFEKLSIESKFQKLSPGGAISYIECSDLTNNIPAVLEVIKFIYDNIMYAELNTKSDYCHVCGYNGEIKIIDKDNKLIWECPICGNQDQTKMNVARRTCGYIGSSFWNQGRTNEIRDRYVHLDDHNLGE